ncbi:GDSL-type esterase/lipase family protein [Pseudonocardia sp. NPDC049154]|uniref:GDSL-type esterase/lipase family protein n=1 Tax=Pseudonocardia sp. NPDC049154 TaxID=3155501 RepID=UPI0033DAE0B4
MPHPPSPTSPLPFLRGGPADGATGSRLTEALRSKLPHDTWDTAQVPAGLRLELVSHAEAVVLGLRTGERHVLAAPTMADAVTVWRGAERLAAVPVAKGDTAVVVPLRADGERHTLHLPEALRAYPVSLVPVGGTIAAAPAQPRWLAYGDSITQGWSATDPGLTYPAVTARRLGLDVWNLGFAGAARGEIGAALQIAGLEADLITLAFGTNNWSALPTGPAHLAGLLSDFVAVVRSGHPETPVAVLSPILRPEAEDTANVVGATLAELRAAFEAEARRLAAADPLLRLVEGLPLVAEGRLADGIHPDDDGHRAMADALTPVLAELGEPTIRKVTP